MSPSSSSGGPGDHHSDQQPTHLQAWVSDHGHAAVAGRDIHVHYDSGGRGTRRVESSKIVEECPYPGLAAFTAERARWFFGRDALTAALARRVADRLHEGGPLVVVAASGAGKSSLLRAGLLPAISQRGVLPMVGSRQWPQLVFTPTAHPMTAAARHLLGILDNEPGETAAMASDTGRLINALGAKFTSQGDTTRIVVVVDQLEELFTLCTDERERRQFLELMDHIAALDTGGRSLGLVVYGLRVDAYIHCVNYPQLRAALQDGQVVVGPMSEEELRQAILLPAHDVGLDVDPGLVELLLRDLGSVDGDAGGYQAGRLPLLAHTLRATWQQRHGHILTVQSYQITGGISDAVATTAEQVFTRLDNTSQRIAQSLFLRLIKIGDDTNDTRRAVAQEDLLQGGPDPSTVQAVLEALTHSRLLTQEQDTVEITHEALLRAWPRLRSWIDEDRANNLVRQQLEEAAATWEPNRHDQTLLLRGSRLDIARAWAHASGRGRDLSPAAHLFLTASIHQDVRTRRRRRGVIAILSVLTLIATAAAGVAFQQRGTIQAQRDDLVVQQSTIQAQRDNLVLRQVSSEANQLRGTDPVLAAKLDLVAYRMRNIPDIYTNSPDIYLGLIDGARTTLAIPGGEISAVAFSPDGHTLASGTLAGGGGPPGTLQLWEVTDPSHPAIRGQLTTTDVASLAFSPDGHTLAGGSSEGTLQLWNITDLAHPKPLPPLNAGMCRPDAGLDCTVNSLAFSRDGHTLVSGDIAGGTRLWNTTDPTHPVFLSQLEASGASLVAMGQDGHILAAERYDDSPQAAIFIELWNLADPTHPVNIGHLTPIPGEPNAFAFNADGHALVVNDGANTMGLWDVTNPAYPTRLAELTDPTEGINSVALSSSQVASSTRIGQAPGIRLWSLTTATHPAALGQLTAQSDMAGPMAFSPDGRTLASGVDTIVLWDMDLDHAIRTICARGGNLTHQQWQQYIPDLNYTPSCT